MRKRRRTLLGLVGTTIVSIFTCTAAFAGSIIGEVKFGDDAPKLPLVKVSKDQDYCGDTIPNETYLIDPNGGLKNVVVFIEGALPRLGDPQKTNLLENNGCRYSPRVMAMHRGERLRVRNNDPKLHIPHSYLNDRTIFNLSLPFRGTSLDATQKIREAGILKVVCDTHAWMQAYIHVFDHPFFSVTDERGIFSIPNIPGGSYTVKAWHEDAGIRSQEIVVSDFGETRVNFQFVGKQSAFLRRNFWHRKTS